MKEVLKNGRYDLEVNSFGKKEIQNVGENDISWKMTDKWLCVNKVQEIVEYIDKNTRHSRGGGSEGSNSYGEKSNLRNVDEVVSEVECVRLLENVDVCHMI